jgi:ABC-type nitrate/sulfonate/bicarbonate transport system substrate-binding protein
MQPGSYPPRASRWPRGRHTTSGFGLLVALAVLVTACAPAAQPSASSAPARPPGQTAPAASGQQAAAAPQAASQPAAMVPLKVGTLPILELLPLFVGKEEGFFREAGLDLELTTLAGGAAGIPALESGSLNLMYSNLVSVLQAVEQGLDLRIVAPGSLNAVNPQADTSRYLVLDDAGIDKLADLRGKRIAINNLRNVNDLYAVALLDTVGLRSSDYTLTEMPFPEMVDALLNKQVGAVVEVEPFITILLDSGRVRDLGSAYYEIHPRFYLAHYVALERWLERNQDTAQRFQRAYFRSVDYVNQNRDKWGAWAVQHVRLKPELQEKVTFPDWSTLMDGEYVTSLQRTRDFMLRYGYLKKDVDPQPLVFK